jgi:hypothetical protein
MRRAYDHLGATQRRPDHSAFSTSSPGEEHMKRSHLFRASSRPSVPTLFVCRADPKPSGNGAPSLPIRVDLPSPRPFDLGSPSRLNPFASTALPPTTGNTIQIP